MWTYINNKRFNNDLFFNNFEYLIRLLVLEKTLEHKEYIGLFQGLSTNNVIKLKVFILNDDGSNQQPKLINIDLNSVNEYEFYILNTCYLAIKND